MKRRSLLTSIVVMVLIILALTTAACKQPDDLETVNECCLTAVTATKITRSVTVKQGDSLLSSEVTVYNVAADKTVNGTVTTTTLPDSITSSDDYDIDVQQFTLTSQQATSALPTSISLDKSTFVSENYTYTNNSADGKQLLTCSIKSTSIATVLGLTADEVVGITNLALSVQTTNGKITQYVATYTTSNGNNVEIQISFEYTA